MPTSPSKAQLVWPSFATALIVGTVLTLANQWSAIRQAQWDVSLLGHGALNVAVPFVVSFYSRWSASRTPRAVPPQ